MTLPIERIAQIERRHAQLAHDMGNPALPPEQFVALSKDYAELTPLVEAAKAWHALRDEQAQLQAIPAADEMHELAQEELAGIAARLPAAERVLALKLLPRDAADERSAVLEIRAGTGGDEAALFAGDLARMYERYAATRGWRWEILSANASDVGGFKEIIASVAGAQCIGLHGVCDFSKHRHQITVAKRKYCIEVHCRALFGKLAGNDLRCGIFGKQSPCNLADGLGRCALAHTDQHCTIANRHDIAAFQKRIAMINDGVSKPHRETCIFEVRVKAVNCGDIQCFKAACGPEHRVEGDTAINPARTIAGENGVRHWRQ